MRPASLLGPALLAIAAHAASCSGDDGASGPDAAPTCVLPSAVITCTVGDDTPCTGTCGNAYCYTFNQVGTLCTQPCTVAGDCPAGWSCNNMGRCRPPG
jgi:hypothetical protein